MNSEKLQEALEQLRSEIEEGDLSSPGSKERLSALVADLERKLEHPDDTEHHETLLQNVKDAIGQLELEHPRATSLLNRIMVTLGNAGI